MENIIPKALDQLANFLEECEKNLGIKYYIVGGILNIVYSVFRTTQDIDFVVDLQSENVHLEKFVSLLKKNEFQPMQDWNSAIILARETKLLQYFDKHNRVKFDNYLLDRLDPSKYKKLSPIGLKRRARESLFGKQVWIASKEDFILSKLVFGGWQDFSDALGCWLRFKEEIDVHYLKNTSKQLNVEKELNLLMSGIEDPDEYFDALEG